MILMAVGVRLKLLLALAEDGTSMAEFEKTSRTGRRLK